MWVDPSRYTVFLGVAAAMCFSPGPANLFSVAVGMGGGRRGLSAAVLGMNLATLVWYLAAALGLSALILAYPAAFRAVTLAGAGYLLWLAGRAVVAAWRGDPGRAEARPRKSARSTFADGFVVQISNPKALLFLGALLPPFLDRGRPLGAQFVLFAVASVGLDVLAMTLYGLAGAALTARMADPRFARVFNLVVGLVLSGVAVMIVLRD